MKSVLRSIKPYWFYLICEGKKTIEVGKDYPKATDWNRTVELYCSKDMKSFNRIPKEYQEKYRKYLGKVGARFICKDVDEIVPDCQFGYLDYLALCDTCLSIEETSTYGKGRTLYGWHISDLKIYDKPKTLNEFKTSCKGCKERDTYHCKFYCYGERPITRPPQSWMFVKEL